MRLNSSHRFCVPKCGQAACPLGAAHTALLGASPQRFEAAIFGRSIFCRLILWRIRYLDQKALFRSLTEIGALHTKR